MATTITTPDHDATARVLAGSKIVSVVSRRFRRAVVALLRSLFFVPFVVEESQWIG